MAVLLQFISGVVLGIVAGFITHALDYGSPWPVMIGVIVACIVWGLSVIVVDGDVF